MGEYGFVDVPTDYDMGSSGPRYSVGAAADNAGRLMSVRSWLKEDAEVVLDHETGTGYLNPELEDHETLVEQARGYAQQEQFGEPLSFVVEKTEEGWWDELLEDVWSAEHGRPVRPDTGFDSSDDDMRFR
jgi:hypothetical protein